MRSPGAEVAGCWSPTMDTKICPQPKPYILQTAESSLQASPSSSEQKTYDFIGLHPPVAVTGQNITWLPSVEATIPLLPLGDLLPTHPPSQPLRAFHCEIAR